MITNKLAKDRFCTDWKRLCACELKSNLGFTLQRKYFAQSSSLICRYIQVQCEDSLVSSVAVASTFFNILGSTSGAVTCK